MKNKLTILAVLLVFTALVLGCGSINPFSSKQGGNTSSDNKSIPEKAVEDNLREKTGVPECDELLDELTDDSKSKDDNPITKATKEFFFNRIRQNVKESVEKNKDDKEKTAKDCRDFKAQYDKQKAEKDNKNQ